MLIGLSTAQGRYSSDYTLAWRLLRSRVSSTHLVIGRYAPPSEPAGLLLAERVCSVSCRLRLSSWSRSPHQAAAMMETTGNPARSTSRQPHLWVLYYTSGHTPA